MSPTFALVAATATMAAGGMAGAPAQQMAAAGTSPPYNQLSTGGFVIPSQLLSNTASIDSLRLHIALTPGCPPYPCPGALSDSRTA
jgi:hypothetical protein